ncbi:hypothetical protein C9374_004157 [Naegleria lovaniensis]|uniref:Uncharacterized protein n=1 Tax=Naegleria lovaniensis TaxID=51637 RepID=A0AA88GQJ4_NAELO|nr:uncharacterized protein C9374_004157 [Naegleria lovaniensis]KAG2383486.1 hypothetical protein C9374_004157 [Naegleria lovaniensis]
MKTCENEPLLYSITHATIVHTIDPNQVASAPPHTIAKPPHVNVVRSLTPMVQKIFSTTYSKVHGSKLNGDVLPHIQLRTPLFSNLPSVFEEMNQVLDRYYTQWEEANFWFRVIWLAFVVLFVLTGGLGLIFICVVYMYRAHVHSNFREKFKTEVKPALQLMLNEKMKS